MDEHERKERNLWLAAAFCLLVFLLSLILALVGKPKATYVAVVSLIGAIRFAISAKKHPAWHGRMFNR